MKVLIADDDPISRRLLESSLRRWGYEPLVANDGLQASHMLQAPGAAKLAVLDWMMPGLDGLQVCRLVRQRHDEAYTYIVLLTAKRNQKDVVKGLDAGADDYVVKPFDPEELKVRLRTGKRILFLQEQLISAREALRELATRDQLTGLWNRAAILDILASELARGVRQGNSIGLIAIDLDHFKSVNDTYGHLVGDAVLREAAEAIRCSVRPYDAMGRVGGEEFLVVLPGCDLLNTASHAQRLLSAVRNVRVDTPSGGLQITASMGIAVSNRGVPLQANQLIEAADEALYRAKRSGRNRAECAADLQPEHDSACAASLMQL